MIHQERLGKTKIRPPHGTFVSLLHFLSALLLEHRILTVLFDCRGLVQRTGVGLVCAGYVRRIEQAYHDF